MRYTAKAIIYDLSRLAPDTRALILKSTKYRKWFSQKPDSMLRLDGSTKVIKGNKLGYRTAIRKAAGQIGVLSGRAPSETTGRKGIPMAQDATNDDTTKRAVLSLLRPRSGETIRSSQVS